MRSNSLTYSRRENLPAQLYFEYRLGIVPSAYQPQIQIERGKHKTEFF